MNTLNGSQVHYLAICDGGCRHNGKANAEGYGSYLLRTADGKQAVVEKEFGLGWTNNEVEFEITAAALLDLESRIQGANKSPGDYSVVVVIDSQLVQRALAGEYRLKAPHLEDQASRLRGIMNRFGAVYVCRISGDKMKKILGH